MKILLTGANGFIGSEIRRQFPDITACPSLRNVTEEDVKRIVEESDCDLILHTAAVSDTGVCEKDPELSYYANVLVPELLAKAAGKRKLICFSSDQVYNGTECFGPYREEDANPVTVYGRHKLEMEERVLAIAPDSVLLRAEWMYSYESPRSNYLKNILSAEGEVTFSSSQFRGVTWAREGGEVLPAVLSLPGGAYNFGSETTRSMYDITKEFASFLGKDLIVKDGPAKHNLWMDTGKAKAGGVVFREVLEGLKCCVRDHNSL